MYFEKINDLHNLYTFVKIHLEKDKSVAVLVANLFDRTQFCKKKLPKQIAFFLFIR